MKSEQEQLLIDLLQQAMKEMTKLRKILEFIEGEILKRQ